MTVALDLTTKQAAVTAIVGVLNTGSGSASLVYKSGGGATLATQTLPSWGAVDGSGNSTCSPIANTTVSATGTNTVTAFTISDKNGTSRMTGTVTVNGGGGDITFDNTSWSQSGTVSNSALTLTTS